jgi:transcription antitermination factor NusG
MNPQNRLPILMTPGVIQIVGVGKTPASVDEDEIAAIQQVEKHSLSAEPWPYPQIGHPVRIEEGPLKGAMGVVVRVKTGMKLVLSVSLLRRSVAVEVDRRWLGDTRETSEAGPVVGEPLRVMATQARIAASCSEGPGAG